MRKNKKESDAPTDSGVRRFALSVRLINVLTVVASKRHAVTTTEVISDMQFKYGDDSCHKTIYRCLECWEACGFMRRVEPLSIGEPIRWLAMTKLVKVSRQGE